jgi:predicted outer membrane repeat protein
MKTIFKGLMACLIAAGLSSQAEAATFYVKASAAPAGNGSSWSRAFNNLDAALIAASSGSNQIWVAKGTYKPTAKYGGLYTGTEANLVTFKLPSNVAIYGGFAGTETLLSQRSLDANPTILSGDLNGNDNNTPSTTRTNKSDNAWHVLTADGVTGVTLDSLIVTDGYAAGPDLGVLSNDFQFNLVSLDYTHAAGGGLLALRAQVTLNNMRFEYNGVDSVNATVRGPNFGPPGKPAEASGGGAIAAVDTGTLVTIKNSTFNYNTAFNFGSNGGALNTLLGDASFIISQSAFNNNVANRIGGAIHTKDAGFIRVSSSVFSKNKIVTLAPPNIIGDESGGAIGSTNSDLTISNSAFDSNSTGTLGAGGGAVFFHTPLDDHTPYTFSCADSIFTNNQSGTIGGGAVTIQAGMRNAGTSASISNSAFFNNVAGTGGAVYVDVIPTTITNSSFIGNQAWVEGGAVFGSNFGDAVFGHTDLSTRGLLTISNSSFKNNTIVGIPAANIGAGFTPQFVFDLVAGFQASVHGFPAEHVFALNPGGGAIASELEGNLAVSNCSFKSNSAPNANGGAILVGGSDGCGFGSCPPPLGLTQLVMDQAYTTLKTSSCSGNTDQTGSNNLAVLNPGNLDTSPNGVQLVTDGSCGP